jgi:ligand-binding sensor domain-containing protein/class 3 adenylate cyclase
MLRHIYIVFLILVFTTTGGIAQHYNFKQYSVEEGLPRSGVYCLLQDSRGFLWTGTEGGGLSRFDGREFVTFTIGNGLPDNTIRSLFEDKAGNLWIGTNGHGLCRYDGLNFKTFTTDNGLSNDYIRCITQGTDGDIWIGTFGGGINRLRFENDSLSVTVFDKDGPLKSDNVRASLTDSKGKLWFGTDEGLCSFENGTWNYLSKDDGLPHQRVLVLYEDELQNLWVGTQRGASKMLPDGFQNFFVGDGLAHNRIRGISEDNLGNIWFGTQDGVSRFNGEEFLTFTEKNGLSNDRIRYITKDRSGNIWFGTFFGGICRFSGEEFIHFTEEDGISNNQVLSIFNNNDGDLWLGTLEGITELKPQENGTWKVERNPLGDVFNKRSINTIVGAPNNEIWFGSDNGILVKKGKEITRLNTDGQPLEENVTAIFIEPEGHIWVGSDQGVTRFEKTENGFGFNQYHSNPNINESEVSSIVQDRFGRVWIGYLSSKIVVFENDWFTEVDVPSTLKDVSSLKEDSNGFIWVSTEGAGLFRCRLSTDSISAKDFEHFGKEQGLSSSDIHQLIFDAEGNLWVGTASGVDQLLLNNRSEIKDILHFGMSEGFIGTETNENASCLDNSGGTWFGTIRGATRYNPAAKPVNAVENLIHITEVNLEFANENWLKSEYSDGVEGYFDLPKNLHLPYAENNLAIGYNGINLRSPSHVKYQWKLEGFSDEWSLIEGKNNHSFTNLSPGEYLFKVRSANAAGIWNKTPSTFTFKIEPPFWMKWWFIALCALVLIALVFVVLKIRETRHLAETQKLQGMVDERTKELRHEKERSDELLLNILPLETAEELKKNGYASVQQYDMVSVLFTDFVGFTTITEGISHQELVSSLDQHFRLFDGVMDKYHIEKIKTIGDAYMAAGGIPTRTITNPMAVAAAGLEMIHLLLELNRKKELRGEKAWKLRLGIHTGSVISGVVGKNKFAFDIWGDAVNTAARMESSGDAMRVNISGSTYNLVKDYFECTSRGKIKAKNKGEIEMYFVNRLKPEYSDGEGGFLANSIFMEVLREENKKSLS